MTITFSSFQHIGCGAVVTDETHANYGKLSARDFNMFVHHAGGSYSAVSGQRTAGGLGRGNRGSIKRKSPVSACWCIPRAKGQQMKLKFLGAGASEGIPAIFCHCALCERARRTGRLFTRSQLLVDDVLLIDFPPDSYYRSIAMGVELADIRNILVTHSHSDHFYADDFFMRGLASSHGLKVPC